jgi:alanyl-tRNA synthetase
MPQPPRSSAEIREAFLSFFEERDHRRMPSAPLVPSAYDPSVLLTTAGMQPFKPYFLGQEPPPHPRLTSCQKCFRTTDIDEVGSTTRHLTFFEMLGNFSFGDYFKEDAVQMAWELSTGTEGQCFGLDPERIWITVFEGDEELGLGPDEEAIECWRAVGVPDERIVRLPRSENFWQAGPAGPCGPCSELYFDRGLDFGAPEDLPGGDNERFLEYWNLVFMQYDLKEDGSLEPLPKRNIDTGLGVDRLAAIQQGVPSVFENDLLGPLVALGERLSGRRYGEDPVTTRALRVLADHGRAMTFLIADGVVPSNEDRGYILRRIMRRAIQQGRAIGLESPFLERFADVTIETMGDTYPELEAERETIHEWLAAEEESFGRTLEQGTRLLREVVERARAEGTSWIDAEDAFKLHDTYGFPYDLTKELLQEEGLAVDDAGFHELMDEQRERARTGAARAHGAEDEHDRVAAFARDAGFKSRFVGYESTEVNTSVAALSRRNGVALAKFPESPFYAEGGGQVADRGTVETESGVARVEDVYRLGDDQAVAVSLERGELREGERARLVVDSRLRHATACNHTATHLLHAALRAQLGTHVRQAGSAVRPDKLRFDFTHGKALSAEELAAVEDQVNAWIAEHHPVRALHTTRARAEELGAMALFGEKYGDEVRVIEVEGVSRELCGGTHVGATSEIGIFKIVSEGSSAANVRRIEAVTGPEAIRLMRAHDAALGAIAGRLRTSPEHAEQAVESLAGRVAELDQRLRSGGAGRLAEVARDLVAGAAELDGLKVVTARCDVEDPKELLELADRVKSALGDGAVVLGTAADGRPHLIVSISRSAVDRGLSAAEVVKQAAPVIGGGGGGRDTMAQAGGRDPARLDEALEAARRAIEAALASSA